MAQKDAYIVIDIGTGNVRVAVVTASGEILSIERENVHYEKDEQYPESIYFDPDELWDQIIRLATTALSRTPDVRIKALTATSQREGIVLIGKNGESLIGEPNIDHRGREWEDIIKDKSRVYQLTGRFPTSLFSALKLVGTREARKDIWDKFSTFLSISDWVQYKLSGIARYEHSQASETLLYDVAAKNWSDELCGVFNLSPSILPQLQASGTILGKITAESADRFGIADDAVVVVGGADTQLAIRSTNPTTDDIVIVSGTTTPIIKLIDTYITDSKERTWTSRHTDENSFILEANAGVTGLNYQRLKEIFYPNESYEVIEKELSEMTHFQCVASLGSLLADEKAPLTKGGFIFNTPVSHQLTRGSFVWATLWDIACSIKENYHSLCDVTNHSYDYIWACGGGVQSRILRQFIANLLNKKIKIRDNFRQSSVVGGAYICNAALGEKEHFPETLEVVEPENRDYYTSLYKEWKHARSTFKKVV
ncbi:sugar kinase [Pedobacter sp. BS3]|uniref:FGGY-family carbohydrate kinase n=1 Tax=Pedobacter sp. BS3 TaxID=2567937 RepID=UPI0011EE2073|nr:FGGY family carbohydrate kinase [Pedobacter sp. BS3]TZF82534.1 sugar kinase [Pedobacter sp. BS3]